MNYPSQAVEKIKQGELVKRTTTAKKTYVRGEYNRESKKYSLTDYNDTEEELLESDMYKAFDEDAQAEILEAYRK